MSRRAYRPGAGTGGSLILHNLDEAVRGVTANIDNMELGLVRKRYMISSGRIIATGILKCARRGCRTGPGKADCAGSIASCIDATLKLLHPFMPFVTEEILSIFAGLEGFLMKASWPTVCSLASAKTAENVGQLMELVRLSGNLRRELNVPQGKRAPLCILASENERKCFEENKVLVYPLGLRQRASVFRG